MAQSTPQLHRGIVKQVLSGDSVIIRGQPKGGPPPERQLCLSNVTAPKLARRSNPNIEGSVETRDEPFAWEAREFLRKKLIGKEVLFSVEYKVPGSGREYGCLFVQKAGEEMENVTESIVMEGLVEVRRGGIKPSDDQTRLCDIEDLAKTAGKGKWGEKANEHVRNITWAVDNPRHFVDANSGKPFDAVIEHVRDGCTVRAFLLPNFEHVTVMMAGVKCPMFKVEGDKQVPDSYADEAKFFTESRLLQREVKIHLQGVSNLNYLGTVIHPAGSISELLLREGFARCVDWSMAVLTEGHDKLRAAEKFAKGKRLRIWREFVPSAPAVVIKDKEFTGKVMEVNNSDAVVTKRADGSYKKIHLSSLRPPRQAPKDETQEPAAPKDSSKRPRPLYDVPFMFEAREFLRKKLIGKKVNVTIDYIKPANDGYPEKVCGTVSIGGVNVAEALISKGFATVLRHRQDDDQRSSHYDELLAAETRAIKNSKGLHSKKEAPIHRVADTSGDATKARQFLPFLQRAGRATGVIEFVASGSRFRLYLPKETCLITFLLAGVSCPRAGQNGEAGELFGNEALTYSKELVMQREVEVEVESIDRVGNFIGWMFVDNENLSVKLVEAGLCKVHPTAERTKFYHQLQVAENTAKTAKLRIWSNYEEPKEVSLIEEVERKCNYKKVVVTEVEDELHFWCQYTETGPQLEQLMEKVGAELKGNPPLPGSFTARVGDLCAALFEDNNWYRAKILKVVSSQEINVLYIDYGNKEVVSLSKMCALPTAFHNFPAQAHEYTLACVSLPTDEDYVADANNAFSTKVLDSTFLLNVEYKNGIQEFASLTHPENGDDLGKTMVSEGLVTVEKRKEKRLQSLILDYLRCQDTARLARLNIWRYGDFTGDEAREFGFPG